jgi:hypothetical protein
MEIQYALMTFGIPTKFLPVTSHGAITLAHHHHFLEQKRLREEKFETSSSSSDPVDGHFPNTNTHQFPNNSNNDNNKTTDSTIRASIIKASTLPIQQKCAGTITTSNTPSPPPPPKVPSYSAQPDVVIPGEYDILLGRGRFYRENPGNARFNYVIEMHMERYEKMGKIVKQVLAEELVDRLKETGSRFLKKKSNAGNTSDGEEWEIVTDAVAREKVSHSFRNRRKLRGLSSSVFSSTSSASNINSYTSNHNSFPPLSSMVSPSLTVSSSTTVSSSLSAASTTTAASTAIAAAGANTSVKIMKHLLLLDQNTYHKDDSEGSGGGGDGDDRRIFQYALNSNSTNFGQSLWGNNNGGGLSGGFIADRCGACFSTQHHEKTMLHEK